MTPFYRINPRWTGIFQSRGREGGVVPRGGFSRVNRSQLGLPAGQQPARVGGFRMVEEGCHSVVEGEAQRQIGGETGGARCHSAGDRGNEPHLFSAIFWLLSGGTDHCLESIGNNSSFSCIRVVGKCRWFQVS